MSTQKIYSATKVLAVFGILLAVYLLWQQLFTPAIKPCSINAWVNCDAVITGPLAKTLGLPTPLYGLVGYIVILWSALFQKKKLLLGTATFGLLFCLRIAYIELVQLRVVCPVCIMCQVTMIAVFALAVLLQRKKSD